MYCGLERKLCIICDTAGFCNNWLNVEGSGIPMRSNSGRPRPPNPEIEGGVALALGLVLVTLFV